MSEIHNSKKRMPLILTPEIERAWLSGKPVNEFKEIGIELMAIPAETNRP